MMNSRKKYTKNLLWSWFNYSGLLLQPGQGDGTFLTLAGGGVTRVAIGAAVDAVRAAHGLHTQQ